MLAKKTLRELRKNWVQFCAVFLMAFICLFIFSGIQTAEKRIQKTWENFQQSSNIADYKLTVKLTDEQQVKQVEQLEGISEVEARHFFSGEIRAENKKHNDSLYLLTFQENRMNRPIVIEGANINTEESGVWLYQNYMEKNKIAIGDIVTVILNNKETKVTVLGSIKQPEFVYFVTTRDQLFPADEDNCYAYISADFLQNKIADLPMNQVSFQVKSDFNEEWEKKQLLDIYGSNFIRLEKVSQTLPNKNITDRMTMLKNMSFLFSGLFLLLTLLTMESTMRRLVQRQKNVIGLMKAMGIKRYAIILHYLFFSFLTSFAGGLLGLLIAPLTITPVLLNLLSAQYSVPEWLHATSSLSYMMCLLVVFLCMLATAKPVMDNLAVKPASLLQNVGETQRKKSKIAIEKFFLWRRIGYLNQWTVRDMSRNLVRCLMGIFGGAGCTILLIAGLGIKDSVDYSTEQVFGQVYHYAEKISFSVPQEKEKQALLVPTEKEDQWIQELSLEVVSKQEIKSQSAIVADEGNQIELFDKQDQKIDLYDLKENEVVVTELIAERFGLKVGDLFYFRTPIELTFSSAVVKGIADISMPQAIFFSQNTWQNQNQQFLPNSILLSKADVKMKGNDSGSRRVTRAEQDQDMEKLMKFLLTIVVILMFAAITLGIIIMLNCQLLIFLERYREFATLKVLGFTQRELNQLAFRENILLTTIGWLVGMPLGYQFLTLYAHLVAPDNQQTLVHLRLQTLGIVGLIVFGCAIGIQVLIQFYIRRINMTEALKSNE